MYFKRIELNGFKSFADPVTIEFTDGITCIVGPNGSGKSNISDAIRWVLGEQSPKSLRGGKMEDVIFAGTQNRKAKGMAEVTLVIDNTERTLPIDYAEVGITRRMYRSGESEYMINRNPCRLKDIRELIMDTGIGVEGFSIIGQGKIANIVSNKMDSRREIFEEAAGIVKYRSKKADTEKDLASTRNNLDRVNDIIGEIEGRIGSLKRESEKAVEYLELRDKYRSAEVNVILRNVAAAEEKSQAVAEELAQLQTRLEEKQRLRDETDRRLREIRALELSLEEELGSIRDELLKKTEEIHFVNSKDQLNKERRDTLEKEAQRLARELASIREKLLRTAEVFERSESERLEASRMAEDLKLVLEQKDNELALAEHALEEGRKQDRAAKENIFELSSGISAARVEAQSLEDLRSSLLRRRERLTEDEDRREESIKELASKLEECSASLEAAKKAEEDLKAALEEAKRLADKANSNTAELSARAEKLRIDAGRYSARQKLLEELENSYEGYGGGVRFLMKESPKGVIGVLGDLLQVPKGWELAVETVLGAKMQDIVCKDDETAKRCIDLLKKNQAGRLTFLPVESLRSGRPADTRCVQGCRGYLGLASDRVRCSSGHQNIVDYMLGKVVIVDTLDNAVEMSAVNSSGLRFVTLEGEIINAAGAITGGSLKNNTANILTRRAEKDELSLTLKRLAAEITAVAEDIRASEVAAGEAAAKREITENALRERQMDIALISKEHQQLQQLMEDSRRSGIRRSTEIDELDKELGNAGGRLADVIASVSEMEEKGRLAEKEAEQVVMRLSALEQAAALAKDAQTAAKLDENKARLALENASLRQQDIKASMTELEGEAKEKELSIEKNALESSQAEEFGGSAAQIIREMEEKRRELEDKSAGISARRQQISAEASALEDERRQTDSLIYDAQMANHDAQMRLARFEAQVESMKDKLFEEFEMSYAQAAELEDPDFVMSRGLKESREYRDRMRAIGDVSFRSIEEYKSVKARYEFLTAQRDDILKAEAELKSVISETDATIKARFKESFDSVVENFEICFAELFNGGHAKLSLENPEDPMESAIDIEAQPPGKRLQNINLLSGGEKTMTAIALMFAVLKSKPTPFVILDEVEAALDENNIDRFAGYLRNFDRTQFALITHQKATMEHADVMYGVTMPEHGVTNILSLRLGDEFTL